MKTVLFTALLIVSQSVSASSLEDSLKAALKEAATDHNRQQITLSVNPDQVEKATFRKNAQTQIIKEEQEVFDNQASTEEEVYTEDEAEVVSDDIRSEIKASSDVAHLQ